MSEQWRAVRHYEGLYEVSDAGRVRALDRIVPMYSARGGRMTDRRLAGHIVAQGPHSGKGYVSVCLCKDGRAKSHRLNVLVCEAFHGVRPSRRHHACHGDGNKENNRATNLRWDTPQGNQADRLRHGTDLRGEQVATAKLTADDVVAIHASVSFAKWAGAPISKSQYFRIKTGQAWAHLCPLKPAMS